VRRSYGPASLPAADRAVLDSLLFTRVPKYEQLATVEKELYHFDKEKYNSTARKGGESLYFSKSGKSGETWVPLVEKAYAKLHGDYASVGFGRPCDAIEDMTGYAFLVSRTGPF
jgi:hypothetical protein